uniref:Uncharacterized protein n=1 Tax=Octopus bimaculoides TaxID=37653 RepID=A0A0L8GHH0_OCTBM
MCVCTYSHRCIHTLHICGVSFGYIKRKPAGLSWTEIFVCYFMVCRFSNFSFT